MKTCLMYVTHAKDFPWLKYSLKSVNKFATGFNEVLIVIPDGQLTEFLSHMRDVELPLVRVKQVSEWPEKGMLCHMNHIMHADTFTDADFIAHFDPDCVFDAPVSPETFIKDGKPVLRYEAYRTLCARHAGHEKWKEVCDRCLPFNAENEFMRGHPEVYHWGLYSTARDQIRHKTGQHCRDFIRSCENSFPQTFTEFPVLGAVAYEHFRKLYFPVDCATQPNPDYQPYPVIQFWSHAPIDQPQDFWLKGRQVHDTPLRLIEALGLA